MYYSLMTVFASNIKQEERQWSYTPRCTATFVLWPSSVSFCTCSSFLAEVTSGNDFQMYYRLKVEKKFVWLANYF